MPILEFTILQNEPSFNYFTSVVLSLAIYTTPIIAALKLVK